MSSAVSTPTTATNNERKKSQEEISPDTVISIPKREGEQDKQEEDQSVEESSEGGEEEEELPPHSLVWPPSLVAAPSRQREGDSAGLEWWLAASSAKGPRKSVTGCSHVLTPAQAMLFISKTITHATTRPHSFVR